jgi:hypothetical protein
MVLGYVVFKENLFAIKGGPNLGPRQYVKKEFPMNGSNGISFTTQLAAKQRRGTRLRPL